MGGEGHAVTDAEWTTLDGVRGWLTRTEAEGLQQLAAGTDVLEIGTYCGRSAIAMAQTATSVTAVDPLPDADVAQEWHENVARVKGCNIELMRMTSEQYGHTTRRAFGLVFIDGSHKYGDVRYDWRLARERCEVIAFHDYRLEAGEHDGRWDAGVTKAVNDILREDGELLTRMGTVAVLRPRK